MPREFKIVVRSFVRPSLPISESAFLSKGELACSEFMLAIQHVGFELREVRKLFRLGAKHGNQAVINVYLIVGPGTAPYGDTLPTHSRYQGVRTTISKLSPTASDNLKPELSLRLETNGIINSTASVDRIPIPEIVKTTIPMFTERQTPGQIKLALQTALQSQMAIALPYIFK